jgi:plasmid maintenance system antidote protein VapI
MATHSGKPNPQTHRLSIVEELRRAIQKAGTEYSLAKATGVSQSVINRFVRGERGIGLETAAQLCDHLRLHLVRQR